MIQSSDHIRDCPSERDDYCRNPNRPEQLGRVSARNTETSAKREFEFHSVDVVWLLLITHLHDPYGGSVLETLIWCISLQKASTVRNGQRREAPMQSTTQAH